MLNPQRNASASKRKFEVGVTTLTLFLCVLGLTGMSILSFFQTQSAFEPLNDPTIDFQGIAFGTWIAFLSALIFQYGQNAALYVKNTYCSGKIIINLFGMWEIRDTTLCWIIFWICAAIDAGTNCLWLYNQPEIRKQHIIFQGIEYIAMIMVVGVEEVLGITLQALAHSFTYWRQIVKSSESIKSKKDDYNIPNYKSSEQSINKPHQTQVTQKPKYEPKHKPNNNQNNQPKKSNNQQPINPFFANKKETTYNKSKLEGEGRILQMMREKQERESRNNNQNHPYPFSQGDEPRDWNRD